MTSQIEKATIYSTGIFYDVCEINGEKFAIYPNRIHQAGHLVIDNRQATVVFLKPVSSLHNISIKAQSVIALAGIESLEGNIRIKTHRKCVAINWNFEKEPEIIAQKGIHLIETDQDKQDWLIKEFEKGRVSRNVCTIVSAIAETYQVVIDPEGNDDSSEINQDDAFEFFGIPLELINPIQE